MILDQNIDFSKLRTYRLDRVKKELEKQNIDCLKLLLGKINSYAFHHELHQILLNYSDITQMII